MPVACWTRNGIEVRVGRCDGHGRARAYQELTSGLLIISKICHDCNESSLLINVLIPLR